MLQSYTYYCNLSVESSPHTSQRKVVGKMFGMDTGSSLPLKCSFDRYAWKCIYFSGAKRVYIVSIPAPNRSSIQCCDFNTGFKTARWYEMFLTSSGLTEWIRCWSWAEKTNLNNSLEAAYKKPSWVFSLGGSEVHRACGKRINFWYSVKANFVMLYLVLISPVCINKALIGKQLTRRRARFWVSFILFLWLWEAVISGALQ